METWKPVVGYEGVYEVSDHGRVRAVDRIDAAGRRLKGRALKPADHGHGYPFVHLTHRARYDKNVTRRVHRLVLEAFVGPRPKGMEACHRDCNRANNKLSNLRWDTHAANLADSGINSLSLTAADRNRVRAMLRAGMLRTEIAVATGLPLKRIRTLLYRRRRPRLSSATARAIVAYFDTLQRWPGVYAVADKFGVDIGYVSRILRAKRAKEYARLKAAK